MGRSFVQLYLNVKKSRHFQTVLSLHMMLILKPKYPLGCRKAYSEGSVRELMLPSSKVMSCASERSHFIYQVEAPALPV